MKLACLALTAAGLAAQHIDLDGTWKWHGGDEPRFAEPDFDDSAWSGYELPRRGPVLPGRSWIRRKVTAPSEIRDPAVTIGALNNCYEVFVNAPWERRRSHQRVRNLGCTSAGRGVEGRQEN